MSLEHGYSLAVEALLNLNVSKRVQHIRVLFLEITRLLNHLMSLTTHAIDVGALTPFLWGFEKREELMSFYEKASGARLHAAYIRPGGVAQPLPESFLEDLWSVVERFSVFIDELEEVLSKNSIWRLRLQEIGEIPLRRALDLGFSGPLLRGSGLPWDLRKTTPYETYSEYSFSIPKGHYGDSYDRYLVRVEEMKESVSLIKQSILFLSRSSISSSGSSEETYGWLLTKKREQMKSQMEDLIQHFKFFSKGFLVPKGYTYVAVEAPKGEFGIMLFSDGGPLVNRCKFRCPDFYHLASMDELVRSAFIADVVTVLGTLDIVLGSTDK